MIPEEEILDYIHGYGYLTVKPREILPSFYKLEDGTILEATIIIESIVPDPRQQSGYQIRTHNYSIAYVPKEERKPAEFKPFNYAEILTDVISEDVRVEILREEFSTYELSNGMVLNIKAVVGQIQKSRKRTELGEPIYSININPIYKFKKKQ